MTTAPKVYYDAESSPSDDTFVDVASDEHLDPERGDVFSQDEGTPPVVRVLEAASTFAYGLGHQVLPAPDAPARQVIWRGQLKERQADGLVRRVNVYRLNDNFWDCYREDELQVA
ncbi:hypothetical protein MON38_10670 [Hymenobacter sp. DH14]|uniref:Uncharacterized protein n=1 Tax=Hymenobacter cyanobacteriorum TaxID=2926463 RepID=A0A9X2AIK9_9BACT|nr:hypothetical protein [Hymenobacter cyanobacteriorum]MCI1187884.1 hypothetical protein [Hymenobacter cyanobacteriorum]